MLLLEIFRVSLSLSVCFVFVVRCMLLLMYWHFVCYSFSPYAFITFIQALRHDYRKLTFVSLSTLENGMGIRRTQLRRMRANSLVLFALYSFIFRSFYACDMDDM